MENSHLSLDPNECFKVSRPLSQTNSEIPPTAIKLTISRIWRMGWGGEIRIGRGSSKGA